MKNGEVSTVVTVEGNYATFLLDGAFAFLRLNQSTKDKRALITDFDGNVLFEGEWSFEAMTELRGKDEPVSPCAVYGDKDTIYIIYSLDEPGVSECIVRYDIKDGKIADSKLLCAAKR